MSERSYGPTFVAAYPFVRTTYFATSDDRSGELPSWKPGVDYEPIGP